jgi:hypothetical protein
MLDFKEIEMIMEILAKTRKNEFHGNSQIFVFRWTERKEKERRYHLHSIHSRTHPNSRTVNV